MKKTNGTTESTENEEIENENVENLEKIVRNYENNNTISIDSVHCTAGSQLGDNYMSVVKRVQIIGTYNNDEEYNRTIIIKRPIPCSSRRKLFRCDEAFTNEIAAYCHLIPIFRAFTIKNSHRRLPYPKCLFAGTDNTGDVVVLEDLRQSGYRMVNRLKGLDYEHCKIVMQELGVLHAVSLGMKNRMPQQFHDARRKVEEIVYCSAATEFYTHSLDSSLREALSSLRSTNLNGELDIPIRQIEKLAGHLYEIMFSNIIKTDDKWSVMCHGDLWINNVMFKYNNSDDRIVDGVKLIDLQTLRYTSPAIDILHFLYSSTESDLRLNYLDKLLAIYVQSLLTELKKHIQSPKALAELELEFSVKNIRKQFNANIMYGLGISMWLLPAVTFHPDKIPDLDSITLSDFTNSKQEKIMTQMQTPEYHKRIHEVVMEFHKKGYLIDCLL